MNVIDDYGFLYKSRIWLDQSMNTKRIILMTAVIATVESSRETCSRFHLPKWWKLAQKFVLYIMKLAFPRSSLSESSFRMSLL